MDINKERQQSLPAGNDGSGGNVSYPLPSQGQPQGPAQPMFGPTQQLDKGFGDAGAVPQGGPPAYPAQSAPVPAAPDPANSTVVYPNGTVVCPNGTVVYSNTPPPEEQKKKDGFFRNHKQLTALLIVFLTCLVINIIARCSPGFCNWHQSQVYPLFLKTAGKLISKIPYSFGELFIAILVLYIPTSLIDLVIMFISSTRRPRVIKTFAFSYAWLAAFFCVTWTLNCSVLYHTSPLAERCDIEVSEHTEEELFDLGKRLAAQANYYSGLAAREENGDFVLKADPDYTAMAAVESLGGEFRDLDGETPKPKSIFSSTMMSQMRLRGIYFPFTLEPNYNNKMYATMLPCAVCHEIAHSKGYMKEDEAAFIAFAACERSSSNDYRYSGYLTALRIFRDRLFESCDEKTKTEFNSLINGAVARDLAAEDQYWEDVANEELLFSSELLAGKTDDFVNGSLRFNGQEKGRKSMEDMTQLMLDYYGSRNFTDERTGKEL